MAEAEVEGVSGRASMASTDAADSRRVMRRRMMVAWPLAVAVASGGWPPDPSPRAPLSTAGRRGATGTARGGGGGGSRVGDSRSWRRPPGLGRSGARPLGLLLLIGARSTPPSMASSLTSPLTSSLTPPLTSSLASSGSIDRPTSRIDRPHDHRPPSLDPSIPRSPRCAAATWCRPARRPSRPCAPRTSSCSACRPRPTSCRSSGSRCALEWNIM